MDWLQSQEMRILPGYFTYKTRNITFVLNDFDVFCQESMVNKMLVPNYLERPTVSTVKEIFTTIARQLQLFSRACPVPGKNPTFTGRKKILRDLSKRLELDRSKSPTFILLYGIAGTGKKSIASELCHQYSESAMFSRGIFWFLADSRRILENSYSKLMSEQKQIGNIKKCKYRYLIYSIPNRFYVWRNVNITPFVAVLAWFQRSILDNGRLLVVYENVKCFSEIQDLLPHGGNITIICTSRADSGDWPQDYQKIMVPLLPLKDCIAFVNSSMRLVHQHWEQNLYSEKENVHHLVVKMGQLTSAIGAALAFITNKRNGIFFISDYLELYKNNVPAQVLPCHAVLLTTAKKINEINSKAFTWLRICSYLDTQGIPKVLLETFLNISEDKGVSSQIVNEIIGLLGSYSVMTYEDGTESFSIPRAVQGNFDHSKNS